MTSDIGLLIFLNPGRQSRHHMIGLATAASRLGIRNLVVELEPIRRRLAGAGPSLAAAQAELCGEVVAACRKHRLTHTLGHLPSGVSELGLTRDAQGRVCSGLAAAGLRHILLWSEHPSRAVKGEFLAPFPRQFLAHASHTHIVRSAAAAREIREMLAWPGVHALQMAEDPELVSPAKDVTPVHDVVAILGYAYAVPETLQGFLKQENPDPSVMDDAMRESALRAWTGAVRARSGDDAERVAACAALAEDWLDAKAAAPGSSFWRLAGALEGRHGPTLDWLKKEPQRWYTCVQALHVMVRWRRDFWLAWLGRRVDLGIYGASAAAYDLPQPAGSTEWVDYADQAKVYARGRVAININGTPDEEGLTQKPFQIAASGVAMVHHDAAGLDDAFEPGREIEVFTRGPELLGAVKRLAGDEASRRRMADAARARLERDHTWETRLERLLELAGANERVPAAAA